MFKGDYTWQHDYVRLASDTGFCFERHKTGCFDKNRINTIDVDRVIEERDFSTIEKLIPTLTQFGLDSEQSRVLDATFVKTVLLCQLTIQYLLFCKKYLDNSLILVKDEVKKLKEDNKELNFFVEDLKEHCSKLMKELESKSRFKCNQCEKVFSSEDFLNSHIKRRHSTQEIETDKLQMEIKELKGRLNDAEKIIQKEQEVDRETESKKVEDLQLKFEELRLQVQSELKILQTQHNFLEKYEKLFERVTLHEESKFQEKDNISIGKRKESTTQTDQDNLMNSVIEVDKENIPEFKNAQKQIAEFGEALENKVCSSLQKIETQMQSFWIKLNEMEKFRTKCEKQVEEEKKTKPRSRTKYFLKNLDTEEIDSPDSSVNTNQIVSIEDKSEESEVGAKKIQNTVSGNIQLVDTKEKDLKKFSNVQKSKRKELGDNLENDVIQSPEDNSPEIAVVADSSKNKILRPLPAPRKRFDSSLKKSKDNKVIDERMFKKFQLEIEERIKKRLQELGVSPEWNGLPARSFQRALEIVNHQANLLKKNYRNFDFILEQIEKNLSKRVEEKLKLKEQPRKPKINTSGSKKVDIKASQVNCSPRIEIKNRKMYDTDSESEAKPVLVKESVKQFDTPFSAVIQELKMKNHSKLDVKAAPEKVEESKGVLKSYPSMGSLTKKKVLFNLESEERKDTGSTTSITSSVFDPTPRKEEQKEENKKKNIEDLSDFEFNDM